MDNALNIGRIFGIQFRVHYSWFFIYLLITLFLAWQVFPYAVPRESSLTHWIMGAMTSLLFFASVLIHETAHSLVGRANGIPVRSITLYLFGGAAQMDREPESPGAELKMALAGPAASLVLAVVFWGVYSFYIGPVITFAAIALWLAQINLIVAVFNLLPGFPLDGGRVLRGIWWHVRHDYEGATRGAIFLGRAVGYLIIAAGVFFIVYYTDWLAGIWLMILGWYLENTARTSLKQFELQIWLKKHQVSDVLRRNYPEVSGNSQLGQLMEKHPAQRCFLVRDEEKVVSVAWIGDHQAGREETNISELAQALDQGIDAVIDDNLLLVVQRMNETGKDFAVVRDLEGSIGLVFLDDLVELVNRQKNSAAANE